MSFNDITDSFSQYPKTNKECKHLKELFNQAIQQLQEENEIEVVISKPKKLRKKKP